jgi:capsular polysaccharide biosynthesis protein
MNIHEFIKLLGKKKQTIFSVLAIFLSVGIIFSAVQPFRYDSNLQLLTIISFPTNIDPYTASRSNQYVSDLLARMVSSGSFFQQIEQSGFNIDKNYFSGNEKKQMKKWNQTVKAKSIADTGVISIDVYHTDRAQAEEIAKAVAYVLQTTNSQYDGFTSGVNIKVIDQPITSNYPVLPNVPINLLLAVLFSLVFSFSYIYLFPEEKYDLRLWPKATAGKPKKHAKSFSEIEFNESAEMSAPILAAEIADDEDEEIISEDRSENFQDNGDMDNILKN